VFVAIALQMERDEKKNNNNKRTMKWMALSPLKAFGLSSFVGLLSLKSGGGATTSSHGYYYLRSAYLPSCFLILVNLEYSGEENAYCNL
jgi:hypothetical protein